MFSVMGQLKVAPGVVWHVVPPPVSQPQLLSVTTALFNVNGAAPARAISLPNSEFCDDWIGSLGWFAGSGLVVLSYRTGPPELRGIAAGGNGAAPADVVPPTPTNVSPAMRANGMTTASLVVAFLIVSVLSLRWSIDNGTANH
jgi:hypothetical protein